MNKALIVGGSNGIGLAVAKKLTETGYFVTILDKCPVDKPFLPGGQYRYIPMDMLSPDMNMVERLAKDDETNCLFISAGIGRVAAFSSLSDKEIENTLTINALSAIRIIRQFYPRIYAANDFYCGVMGSIAGLVSSPLFSVYAASKAAICRLTESVNIELEKGGFSNRILNVSPGSVKGTRFNGGDNQPELLAPLAETILAHMRAQRELYIPQYEEVFKKVIGDYHTDPHQYGLHSYEYKRASGRADTPSRLRVGYLSGTFDLFHIGHLNLIKRAKMHCDYLIVGVHPNASHKKKQAFIPFEERCEIIRSVKYVDKVVESFPEDSDAWKAYHYNLLFVGSDYKGTERFLRYEAFFRDKDVEIVYFPYTQGTSSTQLREALSV